MYVVYTEHQCRRNFCVQTMTFLPFTSTILLWLFNFVFFCAGTFLNSVVIISIRRSSQLRNKICYFTIFLLSCADLAVVVIVHPSIVWMTYWKLHEDNVKIVVTIIIIFLVQSPSVVIPLTLNVERFLAIKFPFFHQQYVTKKRLVGFTAILNCFLILSGSLVWFRALKGTLYISITLISVILVYLNFEMYKTAKSKEKSTASTLSTENISLKTKKSKKTLPTFLLVICLMVFSLPRAAWSVYTSHVFRSSTYSVMEVHLSFWTLTIMAINSSFNCLVFFWKNSILRREGLKTLRKPHI